MGIERPVSPIGRPHGSLRGWTPVVASGGAALGGLAFALAALEGSRSGAAGGPAARLVLGLPEWLTTLVLALLSVAILVFLALLLPRRVRWRRKGDEEFQLYYEPPRVSPWLLLLLGVPALTPVGALVALWWVDWAPFREGVAGLVLGAPSAPPGEPAPARPDSLPPIASLPAFSGAVAALAVLAGLVSLGLVLWILLDDRLARWWARPAAAGRPEPLLEAVEASLDDLRREPDARRAIILCYRRFEQWLARSGFPRAPWETPTEFMRIALSRLPLPLGAVCTVTRLFELSRFSHHPVGPSERDDAVGSLTEIKAALERAESRAPAA